MNRELGSYDRGSYADRGEVADTNNFFRCEPSHSVCLAREARLPAFRNLVGYVQVVVT